MIGEEFKGKKVLVMGLGTHGGGVGTARFFASQGAYTTVTDLKTEKELEEPLKELEGLPLRFVLGKHRKEDFENTDLVIRNPGVPANSPFLKIAQTHGIPIETDGSLFLKLCPAFTIGVTGTKGKSTTVALTAALLQAQGVRAQTCGLPGTSLLFGLNNLEKEDVAVAEFSSWQLEGLQKGVPAPFVALITNIFPDHLKDYASFDAYREAKANILRFQTPEDYAVLNADDENTESIKKQAPGAPMFFGSCAAFRSSSHGVCLQEETFFKKEREKRTVLPFNGKDISLAGYHNAMNVAAAAAAVLAATMHPQWRYGDFNPGSFPKALKQFQGLEGRLEKLGTFRAITFVNDTAATNPGAVIAALAALPNDFPLVLICGGVDKGLDYEALAHAIARRVTWIVPLAGNATEKLLFELSRISFENISPMTTTMDGAVSEAIAHASKNSMVLLSPGAASFNLFKDEFERGRAFRNAIQLYEK